jgi:hypothetical protein
MTVTLRQIKWSSALLLIVVAVFSALQYVSSEECPTPETFSQDFNSWSIEFLDGHPEYGEKEQREGWDKHLEKMGCIEAQDIIDDAICVDCEEGEG